MRHYLGYVLLSLVLVACAATPAEQNNLANDAVQSGSYEVALSSYQDLQIQEPDNGLYYYNAALAFALGESTEDAEAALQQAALRGNETVVPAAYYNLGNLYYAQERCLEAVGAYQEVLRLDPLNEQARFNLELALACIPTITPPPIEMQQQPNDQPVNTEEPPTPEEQNEVPPDESPSPTPTPTATPTLSPSESPSPTPTPTPSPTPPTDLVPTAPSPSPTIRSTEEGELENEDPTEEPQETPEVQETPELDKEEAEDILEAVESQNERTNTFREPQEETPQSPGEGHKDW